MGIRLFVEALDHAPSTLSHRERLLLGVLAEDANDDTRLTWSSVQDPKILRRASLSRTQLYEVLKALIAKNTIKKVAAGQKNGTAKYVILPLAPQCPAERDAETPGQSPAPQDTEPPQRPVHRDTDGKFSVPPDGTRSESQSPAPRDVSVPSSGTPTPHSSDTDISTPPPATPAPRAPQPDAAAFDAFWDAYPRKVAKGNARTAWAKAIKRGAAPEAITAAAARHADHWRRLGTQPRYIPHPATWLNGERYDDALEPAPQHAQPPLPGAPRYTDPAERGIF